MLKVFAFAAMFLFGVSVAEAQLPGMPPPDIPNKEAGTLPKCTKEYEVFLKQQLELVESMRKAPVEMLLKLQAGVDMLEGLLKTAGKFFGGDEDKFRTQLEDLINNTFANELRELGVSRVDFRLAKKLLDQTTGDLERNAVTEIGRIKAELQRCGPI